MYPRTTHARTYAHTHTQPATPPAHTHIHTHTHTRAHAHTHAHARAQRYAYLCGRYDGSRPPTAISMNNHGFPVELAKSDKSFHNATSYVPPIEVADAPTYFKRADHEQFVPGVTLFEQPRDTGDPTKPLAAIRITQFEGGGTAIGVMCQHGIHDAESIILFVKNWAQNFKGIPLSPTPTLGLNERCRWLDNQPEPEPDAPIPEGLIAKVLEPGVKNMPEFAAAMYASFIHFVSCKLEYTALIIIALVGTLMASSIILSERPNFMLTYAFSMKSSDVGQRSWGLK